jgi:AcrR family transcriptional regulator
MPSLVSDIPARGTRPRNRRAITIEAATELFYLRGYAEVGMIDIAQATNVRASALYRHFPSKADLLVAAIRDGIAPFARVLSGTAPNDRDPIAQIDAILKKLVEVAIRHRRLGVLWQRDARNLSEEDQRDLREELKATTGGLASYILAARVDLDAAEADALAWCTMGALVSIGFHSIELPHSQFADLLVDIVTKIATTPVSDGGVGQFSRVVDSAAPESRRDSLITVATELFAGRGFTATGIDEIGDAVGIAGPSVYSHFANKQAILAAAIQRASRILQRDLDDVLQGAGDAPVKLAQLVDFYVRLANQDRFVIRTLLSEMDQLDPADRELARSDQREYINAWVDLLRDYTDEDAVSARIRVQAVLLVVNDAVQTPHLRARAGFEKTLTALTKRILGITMS